MISRIARIKPNAHNLIAGTGMCVLLAAGELPAFADVGSEFRIEEHPLRGGNEGVAATLLQIRPAETGDPLAGLTEHRKIEVESVRALPYLGEAEIALQEGRVNDAVRAAQKVAETVGARSTMLLRAAVLLAEAGEYEEADRCFRRFVDEHAANSSALAGWGGVLLRLRRFDEARSLIERTLFLDPDDLAARFYRTVLNIREDRPPPADNRWRRMDSEEAAKVAGWIVRERSFFDSLLGRGGGDVLAERLFGLSSAEEIDGLPEILRKQAENRRDSASNRYFRSPGQDRSTAAGNELPGIFSEVRSGTPDAVDRWYHAGLQLLEQGRYGEAAVAFHRAARMAPHYVELWWGMACAYSGQGEMDLAWPIILRIAEIRPRKLDEWITGAEPYVTAIRADQRYGRLRTILDAAPTD